MEAERGLQGQKPSEDHLSPPGGSSKDNKTTPTNSRLVQFNAAPTEGDVLISTARVTISIVVLEGYIMKRRVLAETCGPVSDGKEKNQP